MATPAATLAAVADAADTSLSVPYLDAILYLLGISRDAVAAAENDTSPGL